MAYESIDKLKIYMQKKIDAIVTGEKVTFNINAHQLLDEINEMERKAKAFDEVKQYALSKNKDFEDRKDTAGSNKEFNYFNTLQIANRAIINKCKQLGDE